MHQLPELSWRGRAYSIPLAEGTACRIAYALIQRSLSAGPSYWAATLLADPALAVWTCAQATPLQHQPNISVLSLAHWLADQDFNELWAGVRRINGDDDLSQAGEHVQRARAGVVAAQRAVCHGNGAEGSSEQGPIVLQALVQHAWGWLAVPGPSQETKEPSLPGCLDRVLGRATLPAELNVDAAGAFDPVEGCAWDDPAADGWSAALVKLLQQHRRLAALEHEFARELEHAKLQSVKELAYGAGHEINNPLANIATRAQTLLREERHPERRRQLVTINKQAFRAHAMIADLMLFAKPPALACAPVDAARILERVAAEVADDLCERGISLVLEPCTAPLEMEADENQLVVAVRAICQNAMEALGAGGEIRLSARRTDDAGNDHGTAGVVIEIADNGPGISPSVRSAMFDPFYSGREAGRGLGFGLSKAWRIVDEHGGRIDVHGGQPAGARFGVVLPRRPAKGA